MRNKLLIAITIIVALAIVVVGAILGLAVRNKGGERATTSKPTQPSVEITKDGFNPATITVNKGSTITWTNKDTDPHWVASDPHPTHTGLKGFDAGENINAGESYSFPFEKTGTFTYHDHLNPLKFHGSVEVK